MSDLLSIVTQRPLAEKPSDPSRCPVCNNTEGQAMIGGRQTLIGGGDGTVDGDPNHTWSDMRCERCGMNYTRETKSGNVWYTNKGGRLYSGVPSCFEAYTYQCAICAGDVVRRYTALDGQTPVAYLSQAWKDGKIVYDYRTFYRCDACGVEVETEGTR